jgi:hypothetical protein
MHGAAQIELRGGRAYLCGNYALDIAERPRPSPRQRDTGYGTHLKGRLTEFRQ